MSCETCNTLSIIFQSITAVGVVIAVIGLRQNRKSNHYATMASCLSNFRKIMHDIQSKEPDKADKTIYIRDLLGLFNEQIFYLQHDSIPPEIKKEWIETMCKYLSDDFPGSVKKQQKIDFGEEDLAHFSRVKKFIDILKVEINNKSKSEVTRIQIVKAIYKKGCKNKWYFFI